MTPTHFYRYEVSVKPGDELLRGTYPGVTIEEIVFHLVRETPKGYFITRYYKSWPSLQSDEIWVSKNGKKRFAYPTKEAALINFIKRKERRESILTYQAMICEYGIIEAKKQLTNLTNLIDS